MLILCTVHKPIYPTQKKKHQQNIHSIRNIEENSMHFIMWKHQQIVVQTLANILYDHAVWWLIVNTSCTNFDCNFMFACIDRVISSFCWPRPSCSRTKWAFVLCHNIVKIVYGQRTYRSVNRWWRNCTLCNMRLVLMPAKNDAHDCNRFRQFRVERVNGWVCEKLVARSQKPF